MCWYLCRTFGFARLRRRIRFQARSETRSFGFRRALRQPFEAPQARIDITVRPVQREDFPALLQAALAGGDSVEEEDARRYRLRMLSSGLPRCHLAVSADGDLCFMQWLLPAAANVRIRCILGPLFPRLDADTVLLEGAYTPPGMRGRAVMPAAMASIAERGRHLGAQWALTFIDEDNVASIKGARRAGFEPYVLRVERWRWFRRTVTYQPLPAESEVR